MLDKTKRRYQTLFLGKKSVASIVGDDIFPGQWRVIRPDGSLSDHVNLTRAKDAALDQAEAAEARKTPHKSPLKSLADFQWSAPLKRFQPPPDPVDSNSSKIALAAA